MKKSFFIVSLILMSFSFSSHAFSQETFVPKNNRGQVMNLAALAKDAAWRQKISKKWKASQVKEEARKNKHVKTSFVILDHTQEAKLDSRQGTLPLYN
ncbi:hypothetical protein WH96_11910 [Kiloniella spongiae]|uniref:Uncharacterized protein n=1 Tax=Kiloniella spongiae TaxID=1489064 RepID=A0A0H2MUT0_9PROT|nr:hypothetical protein [Kiloniella spongiae]KLN60435.1 hypothetical protein WH96_11910 [Kiloniella spongiae]